MDDRKLVRVLKALADPNRFKMVQLVAAAGEITCGEVGARFDLAQPTISHHMKVLIDAGVLSARRDGQHAILSVNHPVLREIGPRLTTRLHARTGAARAHRVERAH